VGEDCFLFCEGVGGEGGAGFLDAGGLVDLRVYGVSVLCFWGAIGAVLTTMALINIFMSPERCFVTLYTG